MKKLFVFIVLMLFMVSSSFAFSLDDSTGFVAGLNKKPDVNLNTPSENHIYSTNTPLIGWSYNDAEGDEQEAYLIAVASDFQFSDSIYIGGTDDSVEKNVDVRRGEGSYWVRVKVKDKYQWSDWSNVRGFYIDLSPKTCGDGTKFWECSRNVPNYCDQGVLIEDCSQCGCGMNAICQPSGRCLELTCNDGTGYGVCSKNKPEYCQAGNLIEVCSLCGCPKGLSCDSDGSCSAVVLVTQQERQVRALSILERIALFFKGLFGG